MNIKIGGLYRHYKGNIYKVIAIAKHSETLEPMVVYEAQYDDKQIWVRPLNMWNEIVKFNGKNVTRFTKID